MATEYGGGGGSLLIKFKREAPTDLLLRYEVGSCSVDDEVFELDLRRLSSGFEPESTGSKSDDEALDDEFPMFYG